MLSVGVIGCGTIGSEICRAIDDGRVEAKLVGICELDAAKVAALLRTLAAPVPALSLTELIQSSELIVEAVSKKAAPAIIRETLSASRHIMVMSVGGLLDCLEEAVALAKRVGRKIYVPSGAIAGLDAVKGAVVGGVTHVRLTTRKAPKALAGAPYLAEHGIDVSSIHAATQIFAGPAREAVPAFPANINVAAALSLAGIGPDRTEVRIVADPACDQNVHEVEVEGAFGRLVARMENLPSPDNPKTSAMAALSAIALLCRLTSPLEVGT
jgi:aspartate dehydrogenase